MDQCSATTSLRRRLTKIRADHTNITVNPDSPKRENKAHERNLKYLRKFRKSTKGHKDVRSSQLNTYKSIFPTYGVNLDGPPDLADQKSQKLK